MTSENICHQELRNQKHKAISVLCIPTQQGSREKTGQGLQVKAVGREHLLEVGVATPSLENLLAIIYQQHILRPSNAALGSAQQKAPRCSPKTSGLKIRSSFVHDNPRPEAGGSISTGEWRHTGHVHTVGPQSPLRRNKPQSHTATRRKLASGMNSEREEPDAPTGRRCRAGFCTLQFQNI